MILCFNNTLIKIKKLWIDREDLYKMIFLLTKKKTRTDFSLIFRLVKNFWTIILYKISFMNSLKMMIGNRINKVRINFAKWRKKIKRFNRAFRNKDQYRRKIINNIQSSKIKINKKMIPIILMINQIQKKIRNHPKRLQINKL